jgi:excisionase family DNA binding protein
MNKTDAAAFLGIGVRSLERYTGASKVAAIKVKVKTGFALDYEPGELARFKAALDAAKQEAAQPSPTSPPGPPTALAVRERAPLASVAARLANRPANGYDDAFVAATITQAIAVKLLLTLPECQALTGLSRGVLRAAIDTGDLKAKQIGRAYRVKRGDLESYVKKL